MPARTPTARTVMAALAQQADAGDAAFLQRFFKTGRGQYAEGDVFIGVRVPMIRRVCRAYTALPLNQAGKLLASHVHEHRLAALLILVSQYAKADAPGKQAIHQLYLKQLRQGRVNNWDLVDSSAEYLCGAHLAEGDHRLLDKLAASDNLWQRRVAMISTFHFIKRGEATVALRIATTLLYDQHDLIHKAVGWMLREIAKRVDERLLTAFLDQHAATMPRTMLRYAIERLPPAQQRRYMRAKTGAAKP